MSEIVLNKIIPHPIRETFSPISDVWGKEISFSDICCLMFTTRTKQTRIKKNTEYTAFLEIVTISAAKTVIVEKKKIDRLAVDASLGNTNLHKLSAAQQLAYNFILEQMKTHSVNVLHGITGSGKTQVYAALIEHAIQSNEQALYMLPEIALTAQMIRRLKQYFGGKIAIYHSKFNPNERVEIWNKVKSGEIKIVLGARSALFLPYKNLSLIIIDEEHDASYKQQDPAPRYQARYCHLLCQSVGCKSGIGFCYTIY